jgi:hypothetical protein
MIVHPQRYASFTVLTENDVEYLHNRHKSLYLHISAGYKFPTGTPALVPETSIPTELFQGFQSELPRL